MMLNESPVFMLLDPEPRPGDRDLPVKLFESGGVPASTPVFAHSSAVAVVLRPDPTLWFEPSACLMHAHPGGQGPCTRFHHRPCILIT